MKFADDIDVSVVIKYKRAGKTSEVMIVEQESARALLAALMRDAGPACAHVADCAVHGWIQRSVEALERLSSADTRCKSRNKIGRCMLRGGHDGTHLVEGRKS